LADCRQRQCWDSRRHVRPHDGRALLRSGICDRRWRTTAIPVGGQRRLVGLPSAIHL
jgi:hypothetical protein